MHEQLWDQLLKLDSGDVERRTKCQYCDDTESFSVVFLGQTFEVYPVSRKIYSNPSVTDSVDAQFLEQLCLLVYLINSTDICLSGNLVKAEKLEAGQFFFRGPHLLPARKLEESFGENPDLLYAATESLISRRVSFGDASVEILVLPRLPLTFVIWASDEEFSARASILFDETASLQLPLDALMVAVNLTVKGMLKAIS